MLQHAYSLHKKSPLDGQCSRMEGVERANSVASHCTIYVLLDPQSNSNEVTTIPLVRSVSLVPSVPRTGRASRVPMDTDAGSEGPATHACTNRVGFIRRRSQPRMCCQMQGYASDCEVKSK